MKARGRGGGWVFGKGKFNAFLPGQEGTLGVTEFPVAPELIGLLDPRVVGRSFLFH
jgi:hypothetical protein